MYMSRTPFSKPWVAPNSHPVQLDPTMLLGDTAIEAVVEEVAVPGSVVCSESAPVAHLDQSLSRDEQLADVRRRVAEAISNLPLAS